MLHIGMLPLGRVITLWRLEREWTQEALARHSGIPRPNLSMIEQGARDVTLSTLRRLADALGIKTGILADGIPPASYAPREWSRENLDRIARHLVGFRVRLRRDERKAANMIRPLIQMRLDVTREAAPARGAGFRRGIRGEKQNWTAANLFLGPLQVRNLLSRIDKLAQIR